MGSIKLLVKSKYQRRVSQYIINGISLVLASMLCSSSLGILQIMQKPFDQGFNRANASHILLNFDVRSLAPDSLSTWFASQPEVSRVGKPSSYYLSQDPIIFKGKKIDLMVQITEYGNDHLYQDKVSVLQGDSTDLPGFGEIWLPEYLAESHGIKTGDTIGFPINGSEYKLRVSATISDPHYGSGMVNPTRAWVGAGFLPYFLSNPDLNNVSIGIRLKNPEMAVKILDRFNKRFNFSGITLQYDLFKSAFMSNYEILGIVLFIFSILSLIIALFLIYTNISRNILDDSKQIGILKTLGFTPVNVIAIYIFQYGLLATIFIPIGLSITYFILKLATKSLSERAGLYHMAFDLFPVLIITLIIMISIIFTTLILASRKAARIKPVLAIRNQTRENQKKSNILGRVFSISFLSLPCILSVKYLLSEKRKMGLSIILLSITVFIIGFSVNVSSSFESIRTNKAAWGLDQGQVQLGRKSNSLLGFTHQQMMDALQDLRGIRTIIPFSYHTLSVLSKDGNTLLNLFGKAYSDSLGKAGLINLAGSNPNYPNEVSLCFGTARFLHKQPGDSIIAFLEGQKVTLRISGIYQDLSNMGQGFRVCSATIMLLNPLYQPDTYSLILDANEEPAPFKLYLLQHLGETISIQTSVEDIIEQNGILTTLKTIFLIISLFFLSIILLSVWNDMLIAIRSHRKTFGILKTIGFTPSQLRASLNWKIFLLVLISLGFGIPAGLFLGPILMSLATAGIGLPQFPFVSNIPFTLLIIPIFALIVLLCSWIASARASHIDPRRLLNE
jgi:putative ABC transport system permease protein